MKRQSRKETASTISRHDHWTILRGKLVPARGRPNKVSSLFKVVAEKIPAACLADVEKDMKKIGLARTGIYMAHDSMGAVRYAGRGNIFGRLRARLNAQSLELHDFSFFVIADKKHEREIETLIIRTASHFLDFNERKKRSSIIPGNVRDFEQGTFFYERQSRRGRRSE